MKEKIVCVEWDDAGFNSGYYDEGNKDLHQPIVVKTIGHLIQKNKSVIIVATDTYKYGSSTEDSRHISTIPSKMVRKVTYLSEVKQTGSHRST